MNEDPFAQFGAWMKEAQEAEPGEPNAMTLATSTKDGVVSARTVLLRGFGGGGFDFFTNYESRKGLELSENPRAALVLHWGSLQRQVCINGPVERLNPAESDAYFAARPRGHQIAAWASEQSSTIEDRGVLEDRVARFELEFEGKEVPRPRHWGGFRVLPESIEFWQGRPDRLHDRVRFTRDGDVWKKERLAP